MSSASPNSTRRSSTVDDRDPARVALVLRGGAVSCRVQEWSFQPRTAQLVLYHQQPLPSTVELRRWTERLGELGYTKVRTTALSAAAGARAESAGFHSIQELVLLEHTDLRRAKPKVGTPVAATHRLAAAHHLAASAVDLAAFGDGWALQPRAIADVCTATPRHRARSAGTPLAAYAISGRDSTQGFLQRLAVSPDEQRAGLGRALVLDSLQWFARWRVQRVLVNTATDNHPALALYEQLGFHRLGERLRVYERAVQ